MGKDKIGLAKALTGIQGLDEITAGGLPAGRTTLVCGSAGSGKTVLGLEFLVRGAIEFGEPGVFMAFEETADELTQNVASFGFDLPELERAGKLAIDHVFIERSEIEETGEYDLEGLFIRLASAVDSIGAKRVVLDTLEVLFAGLRDQSLLRAELRRLFRWLKERGLTAVVTGERGDGSLTRYGLEEYVADCVILLDHRIYDQISTRRLRIVKYRGTGHGSDEYPFLMGPEGISVFPLTSVGLTHGASDERVSSGVPELDQMLGGKGFFKGSSVLVSGTPGTGKSSLALAFLKAACDRGEKALYFGFEESKAQIVRNTSSIGLNLQPCVEEGLLQIHSVRPSNLGLEAHLASMIQVIRDFDPSVVVIDPISNFTTSVEQSSVKSMLIRLVDFLKMQQVTALFTHLTSYGAPSDRTDEQISSIMDSWILLRDTEKDGFRSFGILVLKSRGMAHSHVLRQFVIGNNGIHIGEAADPKVD
ncbi:circadian clock protein KaiC [Occallatibacter savannae]|uniref:circadian clock protein KaiC n=1 Tax=Occallatibacter savannae TaxID=1002691 RepID=UPI000D68A8A4|nr:circadian clock protein KaiC [Occallatibacter savannae]